MPAPRLWPFRAQPDADGGFSWEKVDLASELKAAIN
jgi:hypothetical protein